MGTENNQLHVFLFPFLAHGHMIPVIDMAKLFSSRGVRTTIITTPLTSSIISKTLQRSTKTHALQIDLQIIKFPSSEITGLPDGFENLDLAVMYPDQANNFLKATTLLQEPLEHLLHEYQPNCLVADMFFPWANEVAAKLNIPRLIFHGTSFFSLCASECVSLYQPHNEVSSDSEPFVIPNLPGREIRLTRLKLPDFERDGVETEFSKFLKRIKDTELESYGVIVNSFYELERDYPDYYRNVLGRKAWHIGPLSLCNQDIEEKWLRGKEASIDEHACLKWLDSKKLNSVVYVSFGSLSVFTPSQLKETAMGLEASGQNFIWVVRKTSEKKTEDEEEVEDFWTAFEERIEGKGLIIRGWAPQVLILDHSSVGGFVTHCGWNSTLEGISAGVPIVTWPMGAEQFYNEKLVTEVLRIGVGVGVEKWVGFMGDGVEKKATEKAVRKIMEGEEAEEMRRRAKGLAEMAMKAAGEGGSSFSDLNALIEELKRFGCSRISP